MELKIFNSILFNQLQPWLLKNCQKNSFSQFTSYINDPKPNTAQELFLQLKKYLKDYPYLLKSDESYLNPDNNHLFQPLFEINPPKPFNSATEFYFQLIDLESIRALNNFKSAVDSTDNSIDKHFRANIAWKNIRYIAVNTAEELHNRGFIGVPDYTLNPSIPTIELCNQIIHFVLYLLKLYSTRLFFEVQELFKDHLNTIETQDHFYLHTLKEQVPSSPTLTFSSFYYQVKVIREIEKPNFSKDHSFNLFGELFNYSKKSDPEILSLIFVLENYLFINISNTKSKNNSFEFFSTTAASESLYKKAKKSITNQINEKYYGHQRLEIIQSWLDELNNFSTYPDTNIPPQFLSVPRKLILWLQNQQDIYKNNLDTVFSPEPDPAEVLKRSSKPLPKKTRAEITQYKAKATELLNFLSGVNIQNIQIMSEAEFTRMLRYTHELIEKEELPAGIIPIPHAYISTQFIRYTYYLIHKSIYGTSRIKDFWIDFLHEVFKQFESAQKTTTKTKFSKKPSLYDSDLKKMKG
jgi:hypothetical protein